MTQTQDGKTIAERAMEVINENQSTWTDYVDSLDRIKDLVRQTFKAEEPVGAKRLGAFLTLQIVLKLTRKTTRPTFTLKSNKAPKEILTALRHAALHWMDVGGYKEVLSDKPGAYKTAYLYGNAPIRIGLDKTDDFAPIKFDNVEIDQVYVDANAVAMRTARGSRQVTRMLVIATYDFDQAKIDFPKEKFGTFGKGRLPNSMREFRKLEKKDNQQADAAKNEVEIGFFYDIGGDKPTFATIAPGKPGEKPIVVLDEAEGKEYPFKWDNSKKDYIPVDFLKNIPELEGFWDIGWGHLAYRLDRVDQIMSNKITQHAITSMSDRSILNAPSDMGGEIMRRIEEADNREARTGESNIVINDMGEPVEVVQMQRSSIDQAKLQVKEMVSQVLRRFGINLDAIELAPTKTLGQVLEEEERENEVIKAFLEQNTGPFTFFPEATIDIARQFIKESNDNLIPTFKLPKKEITFDEAGEVQITEAKTEAGEVIEEEVQDFTYGQAVKWLKEFDDITVEVNTLSGIVKSDRRELSKAITMLQTGGSDPVLASQSMRAIATALGFETPDEMKLPEQEIAKPAQAGIRQAAEQISGAETV